MEKIINVYNLFLNSSQRTTGSDSDDFTISFNKPFTLINPKNRFRLSIPQAVIPYSFSQINNNNNILKYSYLDSSGNSFNSQLIFINGNYNINNLLSSTINYLCNDINIKFVPGVDVTPVNFTFTYNSSEGKVRYLVNNYNFSITFKFSENKILGQMFGFSDNMTFSNIIAADSVNKINTSPVNVICIRSNTINTISNYEALIEPFYGPSDILACVPIMSLPGTYLFHNSLEFKTIINNDSLSQISIYLTDNINPNYNLELNGVEWYLQLMIEEIEPVNYNNGKLLNQELVTENKSEEDLLNERNKIINNLLNLKEKLKGNNEN